LLDHISKKKKKTPPKKAGRGEAGEVAQGVGPEFKLQYLERKEGKEGGREYNHMDTENRISHPVPFINMDIEILN
jgi:hypothetical protein